MSLSKTDQAASLGDGASAIAPKQPGAFGESARGLLLRAGSLVAFAALIVFFAVEAPFFLSLENLGLVLEQSAVLGVLAFGMTIVVIGGGTNIVTGGVDLSLAGNLGLSAAVYAIALQAGAPDWVAVALTLLTGLALGAVNAFSVVVLQITPLLATLAAMNVASGLELVLTQNTAVPANSPFLDWIVANGPFGVPVLGYVLLVVSALLILLVEHTPEGLRLYAVGGHPEAARAAGLPVKTYVAASYAISGLLGGLGGILYVAFLSGSTTGSGEMLLSIVVTAFLGIVFSRRLVPTISGALLSALFIGVLINGFQLLHLSSYWVSGVQGALIILVVAATTSQRRAGL
jgi:ribose transport system permease protein